MYEVMDKIGEGGYAKIFLVEDGDDEFGSSTCVLTEDKRNQLAIKVRLVNTAVSVNSGSFYPTLLELLRYIYFLEHLCTLCFVS